MEIRTGKPIACGFSAPDLPFIASEVSGEAVPVIGKSVANGRSMTTQSEFDVKYIGFPPAAEAAVQKAIDIWAATLKSPVKIRVFINWTVLQNSPNTLAFVAPTEVRNFPGNPFPDRWFPMALAEKIAGQELNSESEADIVATFNAGRSDWYFGTDQQTPSNQFSLTTIALHELGHGLGFSGTFRVATSGEGFYGVTDGQPKIYDEYLFNSSGQMLLNNAGFPNSSFALASQLTGNSLVFRSEIAKTLSGGVSFPRIYAPNPYNGGSSISHLDENTYDGTANSLMTPFIDRGQTQFNIGPLTKGMFYDMGWLYTKLAHAEFADQETLAGKVFQLKINSDTTLQSSSIKLVYSTDAFASQNETLMNYAAVSDSYEAEISPTETEKTVAYFFEVKDVLNRVYRLPIGSNNFSFYFGVDTQAPVISHNVPGAITQFDAALPLLAVVTDNLGLKDVVVEFQINDGALTTISMNNTSENVYALDLQLGPLNLQPGDGINYRIVATDQAEQTNTALLPATGFSSVQVRTFDIQDQYITDLNTNQNEFFGDFSLATPTGFTNAAIHTAHPYLSSLAPEGTSTSLLLLFPIRVNESRNLIEFDEVVLVEPGQGVDHTKPEFGDYVIVEATRDGGNTWVPLAPGYDSRQQSIWLNYYNSNMAAGDSKAVGTLNYYVKKQITITDTFLPGEEIFIRFRLFSNQSNAGWGWAIDNLRIQDVVIGMEDLVTDHNSWVYPNPARNEFYLAGSGNLGQSNLRLEVIDQLGRVVKKFDGPQESYSILDLASGPYILRLKTLNGKPITLRLLKL